MDKEISKYIPSGVKPSVHDDIVTWEMPADKIVELCRSWYHDHHLSLKIITALDLRKETGAFRIIYIFGLPGQSTFLAPYVLTEKNFPSLTNAIHEASIYERRIRTFFGLDPIGHPDPRSLILHENWPVDVYPLRKDFSWKDRPVAGNSPFNFRQVKGEGVYEIPVGPVHAGIIEPGHFRFSVAGEEIMLLEPRLGYSHKGTEKLFEVLPLQDKLRLSEGVSGDSSFSHSLAFCQAAEQLSNTKVSNRSKILRVIFAELERLTNHLGDIGAIMTDTGFSFGGAHGARLRESIMQINDQITGSRFLRGVNIIGGVSKDITTESQKILRSKLNLLEKDFREVIKVARSSRTLRNRLLRTGTLSAKVAQDHGVTGVAGRASGLSIDTRVDYPYAAYSSLSLEKSLAKTGDVEARFSVRIKEVHTSIKLIKDALNLLSQDSSKLSENTDIKFNKSDFAISLVEGWRGEIVYLISTDSEGNIDRVALRDPSFLTWTALGYAGKGNVVPDFPLINKSFNLSYSGNDL